MADLTPVGEEAEPSQRSAGSVPRSRWVERWDLIVIGLFAGVQSASWLQGWRSPVLNVLAFVALILVCVANAAQRAQAPASTRSTGSIRREWVGALILVLGAAAVVALGWKLSAVDGIDWASWATGVVVFLLVAVGGVLLSTPPERRHPRRVS